MAETFSLELLGPVILETRDRIGRMEADIAEIKRRLDHHHDELNVVSGLALRATGERIAWSTVQSQLNRLAS